MGEIKYLDWEGLKHYNNKIKDKYALKDGYYGSMTVGTAENLVGRGSVEAEYTGVRTSAGTADIGSGSATIVKMMGNTIKWNQLVNPAKLRNGTTSGVTVVNNGDGSFTITGTIEGSILNFVVSNEQQKMVAGHKYLLRGMQEQNTEKRFYLCDSSNSPTKNDYGDGVVYTSSHSDSLANSLRLRGPVGISAPADGIRVIPQIIDLTAIFGEGNEPATVEEFEAWLAENVGLRDYYPYNPGEIINNGATGITTYGFNLYDYATGKAYLPGKYSDYPQEYEICGTFESISFTDINGNTYVPELTDGKFFNVSAPGELTVVGGNNTDTLVHLVWSGWRNEGKPDYVYESFWKNTLPLNLKTRTGKLNGEGESVVVFPNGLAKIGDVQDEIKGNVAIKRIGIVDLGTLTWTKGPGPRLVTYIPTGAKYLSTTKPVNAICILYSVVPPSTNFDTADKVFAFISKTSLVIADSSYTSANTFKTAMQGVLLYYELATPKTYILDEELPSNYRINDFGTEQVEPAYTDVINAPIRYEVQYAMNAVDAIRRLPDTYLPKSSLKQSIGKDADSVVSQKVIEENYAHKTGVENELVVGAAKALAGNQRVIRDAASFAVDAATGVAKVNEVMGNSRVWNQRVQYNANFFNAQNGTGTFSADGVYDFVSNDNSNTHSMITNNIHVDTNDRILAIGLVKFSKSLDSDGYNGIAFSNVALQQGSKKQGLSALDVYQRVYHMATTNATGDVAIRCGYSTTPFDASIKYLKFFNLTKIYGAGNEPTTVEQFEADVQAWFGKTLDEYFEYDAGSILSAKTQSLEVYDSEETLRNTMPINITSITGKLNGEGDSVTIFPDGMRSAGTVFDSLIVDDDGYARKAVVRVGSVDLGNASWSVLKENVFRRSITSIKKPSSNYEKANVLCIKYVTATTSYIEANTIGIGLSATGMVTVRDSSYTDAVTFKEAISGIELIFESNTPLEYTLDEPILMTFNAYNGGVIKQVKDDMTMPAKLNMTFALNAVEVINGLPEDYISATSMDAFLAQLSTAMGGTWTRTYNATTQKHEFSFVKSENTEG